MNRPIAPLDRTGSFIINAAAARDAAGTSLRPARLLIQSGVITQVAYPSALMPPPDAVTLDLPDSLLLPAFVNAHAHLDLSHLGPMPHSGGFLDWIEIVRHRRLSDPADIGATVRLGITLSLRGGTAAIADIAGAGSLVPAHALIESNLLGVSTVEIFGIGPGQQRALQLIDSISRAALSLNTARVRIGLQPHAPYSASLDVYRAAASAARTHNLPLSTHLAETLEEIEFTRNASGPLANFLKRLGAFDSSITATGLHPIDYLADVLRSAPWLCAHVNYADDSHLRLIAESRAAIAYCPRASAYFGHTHHRYRDMLAANITVALGTDSILCLDTPDRLSILDEMSFLFRRDATSPDTLLKMATINGAAALNLDPSLVTLSTGSRPAGLIAIPFNQNDSTDPLQQILRSPTPAPIHWLLPPA